MKKTLTNIFWPILQRFEQGEGDYNYSPSRRIILMAVGSLMLLLSVGILGVVFSTGEFVALVPVLVFLAVGTVSLVVGSFGSDRAVANIWGNK